MNKADKMGVEEDLSAEQRRNPFEPWLEACTLVALATIPLAISPLANFFFEETKAFLFQSFGLCAGLLLVAWAIAERSCRSVPRRVAAASAYSAIARRLRSPIVVALLYILLQGVSTLFALQRSHALRGAPTRGGGWLTLLAGGILMAVTLIVARRPRALLRLLQALALGSLAPAAIAVLQYLEFDPLAAMRASVERVSGSFGNPMFLGSFLAIVSPLTIWLVWQRARHEQWLHSVLYGAIALLQLAALWFTGSRGPLGGWLLSFALLAPFLLLASGRQRTARQLASAVLLLLCLLILLFHTLFIRPLRANESGSAREKITRVGSVLVRLHIYRAVTDAMLDSEALPRADRSGRSDRYGAARRWIGYGPQNISLITPRHFPAELERLELPERIIDSAHNQLLRIWADSGIIGLFLWLLLLVLVLRRLLRAVACECRLHLTIRSLWPAATLFLLIAWLIIHYWGGWAWPLALSLGFSTALPLIVLFASGGTRPPSQECGCRELRGLPLALFGSFMAYTLDLQSNVQTVTAFMCFWLVLGLIICLKELAQVPHENSKEILERSDNSHFLLPLALIVALFLHTCLTLNDSLSANLWHVLGDALRAGALPLGVLILVSGVLLAGGRQRSRWLVVGALWLAGIFLWSLWLARLFGVPLKSANEAIIFGDRLAFISGARFMLLAFGMAVLGKLLAGRQTARRRDGVCQLTAMVIIIGAAITMLYWPRSGQRAAALDATAQFLESLQRPDLAILALERALGHSPWEENLQMKRYRLFLAMANQEKGESERNAKMLQALQALRSALSGAPYDSGYADRIGRLYYQWALLSPADDARQLLGREAIAWLTEAARLMPGQSTVGLRAVDAVMRLNGDSAQAEKLLHNILANDPGNSRAAELLAYLYDYVAKDAATPFAQRQRRQDEARRLARQALASPWLNYFKVDKTRLNRLAEEK